MNASSFVRCATALAFGSGLAACAGSSQTMTPSVDAAPAILMRHIFYPRGFTRARSAPPYPGQMLYHDGDVQTAPSVYVVYWGFTNDDPAGEAARLTKFLQAVGGSSWLSTVTQYTQQGGAHIANPTGQLKGVWNDTTHPVPLKPTVGQIAIEADLLVEKFGASPNASYIVATPHGHNYASFPRQICAEHDNATVHGHYISYTILPYINDGGYFCGNNAVNRGAAGKLDGVSIIAGHELAETQTDPGTTEYGGGWWDGNGYEIADKCAWFQLANTRLSDGAYYATQPLWSNVARGCAQ
ncbi:MAG: hypothetical protein JO199_01410 [Candidatus Eremiobacteraeota bacterium]|nr:hypothetical protein [Candidatus Eremiobacteraeota bacterium]